MKRTPFSTRARCASFSGVFALSLLVQACSSTNPEPPRPKNVPLDAVRLGHAKGPQRAVCSFEKAVNRCRVFNAGGVLLRDDVFLPYDGGPAVPAADLRIRWQCSQIDSLCLENGRYLLPRTDFERHKELLEKMK